jgi:hypothetical protein
MVAALGIAAGIVGRHRGWDDYGTARIVPLFATATTAPQRSTQDWLDSVRRDLAIQPDQALAWQAYAKNMTDLKTSSTELEGQLATGGVRDVEAERARHAMVVANALAELERHLSPEQQTAARLLTRIRADSLICQALAVR